MPNRSVISRSYQPSSGQMPARLGTARVASQRQTSNGRRAGGARGIAQLRAVRLGIPGISHLHPPAGRRADRGGVLQLRRTQRSSVAAPFMALAPPAALRRACAIARNSSTDRSATTAPNTSSGASASHIGTTHQRLTGAGRSSDAVPAFEIHGAEMIEEADEDDDQQHRHDDRRPVVPRSQSGAQDDEFAERTGRKAARR